MNDLKRAHTVLHILVFFFHFEIIIEEQLESEV